MNKSGDTSRCVSILKNGAALIYKEIGESMGQVLRRARHELGFSQDEKMTFAGRLDELASGWCIVLWGDERFNKEQWLGLDKTYKVSFVLGLQSKSLDILNDKLFLDEVVFGKQFEIGNVQKVAQGMIGEWDVAFPNMSAYKVGGMPLWNHARNGVQPYPQPYTQLHVLSVKDIALQMISLGNLKEHVIDLCNVVQSDFNQKQIIKRWNDLVTQFGKDAPLPVVTCTVHVGSGSYVRSFAEMIARRLGSVGCVSKLERVEIGGFI